MAECDELRGTRAMTWAAVLGGVGAFVGVASFLFTVYAWRSERRERRAADADERKARVAEIAIERERLGAEVHERERQHRADITASQIGHMPGPRETRLYKVRLRNMGPSYSKHVRAWLQTEDESFRVGIPRGIPLDVREQAEVEFAVPRELWEATRPPLELMVQWHNDEGQRMTERSNLEFDYDV
jgi:hypothetical protein